MGRIARLFGLMDADDVASMRETESAAVREAAQRSADEHSAFEARVARDFDEYAFRLLSGGRPGDYALPQSFVEKVLRDSAWIAQTHGLGRRILLRVLSIMTEAGFRMTITPARPITEGDARTPDVYDGYTRMATRILNEFWYGEQAAIQPRLRNWVFDALVYGESGLRVHEASEQTGRVEVGSFSRRDVSDITLSDFDRENVGSVTLVGRTGGAGDTLTHIGTVRDASEARGHLSGDCIYLRLGATPSTPRGIPVLQTVIDELKAEKRFRILATDRSVARMSLYMDTLIKNTSPEGIQDLAKKHGTTVPMHGYRFWHSEDMENKFLDANLEAGDINTLIQTAVTLIVGAMGHPLSWYGFGVDTNRATAETQQGPAAQDSRNEREQVFALIERLLYFVLDRAILRGYAAPGVDPQTEIPVLGDDGAPTMKRLRDCISIKVGVIPLVEEAPTGGALDGTSVAIEVVSKAALLKTESGYDLFQPEQIAAIVNHGLARDGVPVEVDAPEDGTADGGAV